MRIYYIPKYFYFAFGFDALLQQGMANGAAMSFAVAGGVSCIPAAVAVWALVKPRVFAMYLVLGVSGAVLSGILFQYLV